MKLKYYFVSLLLLSSLSSQLTAQKNTLQFSKLTINDGLSQSYINAILQDHLGYIWIGTQDGLNRYDGQSFRVFQNQYNDESSLSNNYINAIVEDQKNNIWIGTDRGLNLFDYANQKLFRWHFESIEPVNQSAIQSLSVDHKNRLWVVTEKNGLFVIDTDEITAQKVSLPHNENASNILIKKEGSVIVSTKERSVFWTPKDDINFQPIIKNSDVDINKIKELQKKVYLTTTRGLLLLDGNKTRSVSPVLEAYNTKDVVLHNDALWIATFKDGLIKFDQKNQKTEVYNESFNNQKNLTSSFINVLYKDQSGIIWLGTEKGISKFDVFKQGFNHITSYESKDKGPLDNEVWSFKENKKGQVWIGTKSGISIFDETKESYLHFPINNNSGEDWSVFDIAFLESDQYDALVATANGLLLFSQKNGFENFKYGGDDNGEKVYNFSKYNDSLIVFSTKSGIGWINTDLQSHHFVLQSSKEGLGTGGIKYIFQAKNKWYIVPSSGIYELSINKKGDFEGEKAFTDLFKENRVFTIGLQTKNILWLGTYGAGLLKYDLEKEKLVQHYTESSGLPNNVIYAILPEDDKTVWISTNRGLAKVTENKIFKYTQEDGLQSNEFNSGAALKTKNGKFYFGGINGFNWFYPNEIGKNKIPPKVIIEDLHIFNSNADSLIIDGLDNSIQVSNKIQLQHYQNSLTFHLAALHYSDPSDNKFKLKLVGIDEEFRIVRDPTITYTALPPGTYELIVSASNADGVWSDPIHFKIIINTPFWATWWFRILVIVLVVVVIIYAYRKRIDNIRRQKIKLELKIVERTRELREQSKKIEKQKKEVERINAKVNDQNQLLEKEKEKVEQLLLNILPEDTARELRDKGKARARNYRKVSIMFTDFVGFTKKAEDYTPSELVERLDGYFSRFDSVIEKYNLEKIKTIGDAYMCAGGIPIRNKTNPIETVLAGLEIQKTIAELKKENKDPDDPIWDLRIGVNTGEIVAGVIGSKRFAYDIWGQAVNLANRMETHGEAGKVNVSEKTFDFIEPYFECTFRGKIKTKSSGYVNMYFVDRIKPELSEDEAGVIPNDKFWKIVNLHTFSSINYMKAERFIMKKLEKKLSPKLYYHSIEHTKDVTKAAERLAIMEGITDEGLFLLKSAATYHDAGFVEQYDHNEPIGVRMSREILPKYGYTEEQIEIISGLIYATKIPHKPTTLLQEIICDADLDYLGREDFHEIADKLRLELREHGKIDSDRMWDEIQVKFLTQHQYFTDSAIKLRQELKEKHIEDIKQKLKEDNYKD